MENFSEYYNVIRQDVISEINSALASVDLINLERLAKELLDAQKVFFVGVGRVMLSLEAIAKRFYHLGISAHCVGDITEPAITENDLLVIGSGSGVSVVPLAIARKAKEFGAKVVQIGSNPNGDISKIADFMVRVPVRTRLYLPDEVESCQIMTSLFEQVLLILGDILAKMIADMENININELWESHANLE